VPRQLYSSWRTVYHLTAFLCWRTVYHLTAFLCCCTPCLAVFFFPRRNHACMLCNVAGLPLDLVIVSQVGFVFGMASMTKCTILSAINGVETPNLEAVVAALSSVPDSQEFTVSMRHVLDQRYHYVDTCTMDRRCVTVCV
jgi:hypothetical protein